MPTKTLATLLRVVIDQGFPVERALDLIELDFNPLESGKGHPKDIPTASYSKLYRLLMELLQDEAFGLGQQYHSPPGTFRMMCLFVIHCPTLEAALIRSGEFFEYCNLYRDNAPQAVNPPIKVLPDGGSALCLFERHPVIESDRNFIGYANILLMMYRFYSWLIGRQIPLREVRLRANTPASSAHYENLFNCPVRFGQENSGLVVSTSLLQYPVAQNEETLKEFLRQTPYQLVSSSKPGGVQPLTRKVQQLLIDASNQQAPTAKAIASALNMSPRTLHRKLTQEDSSFQQIKDDYRRELAVHYIGRPELTIDAIAALMGFQDNSAFYRSFKKWTGQSPGHYRKSLIASAARDV